MTRTTCSHYIIITHDHHLVQAGSDEVATSRLTYREVGTTDDLKQCNKHFPGLKLWDNHPAGERVKGKPSASGFIITNQSL